MRARFAEVADAAQREQPPYRGSLAELLMAECDDRDRRRSARRITAARFPREKWPSDVDDNANPHIQPAVIAQLATCTWVGNGKPLCLISDSGTRTSHLLNGLGAAAAMTGHRVSGTSWPPSSSTSSSSPPTNANCPRPSPATAASTCSASTNPATWS